MQNWWMKVLLNKWIKLLIYSINKTYSKPKNPVSRNGDGILFILYLCTITI